MKEKNHAHIHTYGLQITKAASLYSEFANSKNLKETKIMPETLTFSVVNWKESDAECTFTVVNSGFGYTTQLQNKYYHTSFGLFILTNNTFFLDIYICRKKINFWSKSLFYFTTTFFTSDHFV